MPWLPFHYCQMILIAITSDTVSPRGCVIAGWTLSDDSGESTIVAPSPLLESFQFRNDAFGVTVEPSAPKCGKPKSLASTPLGFWPGSIACRPSRDRPRFGSFCRVTTVGTTVSRKRCGVTSQVRYTDKLPNFTQNDLDASRFPLNGYAVP